ncbi:YdeI/OmpD-associated family protein [Bergeyella porcorum]
MEIPEDVATLFQQHTAAKQLFDAMSYTPPQGIHPMDNRS